MSRIAAHLVLLPIFLLVVGVMEAVACKCAGGANPCGAFAAEKGVIFVGTVTQVVASSEKYGKPVKGNVRRITIQVDEVYKGTLPSYVVTSDDGFSCDNFPFKVGLSYLVYSKGLQEGSNNILPVGLCSGTRAIDKAAEDLKFLRALRAGERISTIYGRVDRFISDQRIPNTPFGGIKVRLVKEFTIENGQYKKPSRKDREQEVVTDQRGEYVFNDIPTGRYRINIMLPQGFWLPESRDFWAGGQPYCANYSYTAMPDGRISGKIVNPDGRPASRLAVNLGPLDPHSRYYLRESRTDEKGQFTFWGVPSGDYRVGVPLGSYSSDIAQNSHLFTSTYTHSSWYYYPGVFDGNAGSIIKVGEAQKITGLELRMPALAAIRIVSGTVDQVGGEPLKNLHVIYKLPDRPNHHLVYARVSDDGSFSFKVFEDSEYQAWVSGWDEKRKRAYSTKAVLVNKSNVHQRLRLTLDLRD